MAEHRHYRLRLGWDDSIVHDHGPGFDVVFGPPDVIVSGPDDDLDVAFDHGHILDTGFDIVHYLHAYYDDYWVPGYYGPVDEYPRHDSGGGA